MQFRTQLTGFEFTLIALENTKVDMRAAGLLAVEAGGRVLLAEVRRAVSRRDHSPQRLAELDHPYARRHGQIRIHSEAPWVVHEQSGRLLSSLTGSSLQGAGGAPSFDVMFNPTIAPHETFVLKGTKFMLPRDPIWSVARLATTREKVMLAVVRSMQRLRAKVGIRFGSDAPSTR